MKPDGCGTRPELWAELPDLTKREETFPVVLYAEIRRDPVRGEQVHHLAHGDACELGRFTQRGLFLGDIAPDPGRRGLDR